MKQSEFGKVDRKKSEKKLFKCLNRVFKNVVLYNAILHIFSVIKMENGSRKVVFRMAAGVLVAITIIVTVFVSGVTFPGLENNPSLGSEQGRLTVLLKDAPVDLDHLMITITALEVHKVGTGDDPEGGWMSLLEAEEVIPEFDLLLYQGDETLELASRNIPDGTYNKIRMYVSGAFADYAEESERDDGFLKVPPGKIDVITNFELKEGGSRIVIIDMEPDWVAISKSNNLRPVLKATISEKLLPPEAEFTYLPAEPITDQEITFDASDSTDDGIITNYSWDFGDGSAIQTGVNPTHIYELSATYEITLTVTDDTGLTDEQLHSIIIHPPPTP